MFLTRFTMKHVLEIILAVQQHYISLKKALSSSGKSVIIRFYDELYQPNAIDKME